MKSKIEGQGAIFDISPLNESVKKSKRKIEKQVSESNESYPSKDWLKKWINREWRKMTVFEKEYYKEMFENAKPQEVNEGDAAIYALSKVLRLREKESKKKQSVSAAKS